MRNIIQGMIIPIIPTKKYIDELRDDAGLSDSEIAHHVNMDRSNVWKLRNGKHKTVSLEHGIAIANLHATIFKNKKITEKQIKHGS